MAVSKSSAATSQYGPLAMSPAGSRPRASACIIFLPGLHDFPMPWSVLVFRPGAALRAREHVDRSARSDARSASEREDTRAPDGAGGLRVGGSPEPLQSANALSNCGGGGVPAARIMGPTPVNREDTREPYEANVLRVGVGPHAS